MVRRVCSRSTVNGTYGLFGYGRARSFEAMLASGYLLPIIHKPTPHCAGVRPGGGGSETSLLVVRLGARAATRQCLPANAIAMRSSTSTRCPRWSCVLFSDPRYDRTSVRPGSTFWRKTFLTDGTPQLSNYRISQGSHLCFTTLPALVGQRIIDGVKRTHVFFISFFFRVSYGAPPPK